MPSLSFGFEEALRLALQGVRPLAGETVPLLESVGRVAAADLRARVDSPALATSRKDGYALRRQDAAQATKDQPARLKLVGSMAAGDKDVLEVGPKATVRVLTGARIPHGADAVVAEEYTRREGEYVLVGGLADTTKNILPAGGDVARGDLILEAGQVVSPVMAGLLAAAGHHEVPVYARPKVGILGTGDELRAPGDALAKGELYASNLVTLAGFCRQYGMTPSTNIVSDDRSALRAALGDMHQGSDALITSGGAWRGDRDLVARVLEDLGWQKVFHRIRMGPGKAVGFGLLGGKPVFVLPGGPPSNLMGFLQIALPGLLALCGRSQTGLPRINARLAEAIDEGNLGWTDFFQGALTPDPDLPLFHPLPKRSRLSALARATAVAAIPEDSDRLEQGVVVSVQLLPGDPSA